MNSRETILHNLQKRDNISPPAKLLPLKREQGNMEQFAEKARAAGARVQQAASFQDIAELLTSILKEESYDLVYHSSHAAVKETVKLVGRGESDIWCEAETMDRAEYRRGIFQAAIGLSACDALVAESGTIMLRHNTANERLLTLAPNHLICLVNQQLMLPDLQSLASHIKAQDGNYSSAFTLITGVSRTADVGLQVVLGMHGPRQVDLIIYNDEV